MPACLQELVPCYVYATWVSTGAIACVETGGHHRPNHHANNALQMFRWAWHVVWALQAAGAPDTNQLWKSGIHEPASQLVSHLVHPPAVCRSLEWAIGDASAGVPGEGSPEARVLAARRLHTRLPSISGEFRVSTPLTRIRWVQWPVLCLQRVCAGCVGG